jgi:membrane protein
VSGAIADHVRAAYQRIGGFFFSRDIWERRLDELPPRRAAAYRAARIAQRTFRGLVLDDALHVRAAALTYFTVLSLVPFLAFVFAVLKGFGAYDVLIAGTIRPYVLGLLSGNRALGQAFDRILSFVEQTGVASLGFVGLLTLLYAATRLLRNIESALNALWEVRTSRSPLEQLRDYISIIAITPLCLMAAAAFATAGQAVRVLRAAGETLGLGFLVDQALAVLGPLLALFFGLLLLYRVMPCTHVRIRSAALGAALAAIAWYLVLIAHVRFQIGVARFNALYSSFAAVPIFLAWLHVSWLVILLGAQVAATHQNGRSLAQRTRLARADQALRESICIAAMLRISASFSAGQHPPSARSQSAELDIHEPLLTELLEQLVQAGLLVKVEGESTPAYVLARPAEQIRLKDVLDALRRPAHGPEDFGDRARVGALAARLWQELDDALARSPANRTLRELIDDGRDGEL